MARVIIDREYKTRPPQLSQQSGEEVPYEINFNRLMTERGTSVSSVVWSSDTAQITDQVLASNVASANITSTNRFNIIKIIATQADGSKRTTLINIYTIDANSSLKDYR